MLLHQNFHSQMGMLDSLIQVTYDVLFVNCLFFDSIRIHSYPNPSDDPGFPITTFRSCRIMTNPHELQNIEYVRLHSLKDIRVILGQCLHGIGIDMIHTNRGCV